MNGERTAAMDDDCLVVARFMRGDTAAFDSLFLKYQDYVYNIVYGIVGSAEEARDLSQEVFVQAYRSLPKFRHGAKFATWLYRIAVNRAVDAARCAKKWRFLPILDTPGVMDRESDSELGPELSFMRVEERQSIQKLLMRCPLNHRDVLVLRYYRGQTVEEIAETLGVSISAAKVRLHRARRIFKDVYVAATGVDSGECPLEKAQNDAGG